MGVALGRGLLGVLEAGEGRLGGGGGARLAGVAGRGLARECWL